MDFNRTMPNEPTLGAELRSSALLLALAVGSTAGAVGITQLAVRVLA